MSDIVRQDQPEQVECKGKPFFSLGKTTTVSGNLYNLELKLIFFKRL